jgi:peptidoglycan/LPS O-acetylase OafA/YrhL
VVVATPAALSRLPDGGRFVALDSWRGLAALGVAAYHINGGGVLFDSPPTTHMWLFVDFFFVLSGFVLAAAYGERLAQGFPIGRFMLLRLGRVYPLHLLMVLAYVALEGLFLFALPADTALREPFTGVRDPWYLLASLLLVGPWFEPPLEMYNSQSWSIAVEIWLYLAFALALRLGGRRGWWVLPAAAFAAMPFVAVPELVSGLPSQMLRGVLGFGLGVAAWRARRAVPGLSALSQGAASFAELAAVVALFATMTLAGDGPLIVPLMALVFTATVLIFAGDRGVVSRLLRTRPFVWLGAMSYSFYMVHGMVIGRLADVLRFAGLGELSGGGDRYIRSISAGPWLAPLLACATIAACLPVAWLTWRFVEAPAREWSRRRAARMGVAREETSAPTI